MTSIRIPLGGTMPLKRVCRQVRLEFDTPCVPVKAPKRGPVTGTTYPDRTARDHIESSFRESEIRRLWVCLKAGKPRNTKPEDLPTELLKQAFSKDLNERYRMDYEDVIQPLAEAWHEFKKR